MYSYNSDILSKINIPKNEEILYLDNGISTYFIGNKSYLDEHYPLCVQRIKEGSDFQNKKFYTNAMQKLLNYDGEYIILHEIWFFKNNKNPLLQEKINNEYRKLEEIITINCKHTIFKKQTKKSFRRVAIYKRIK